MIMSEDALQQLVRDMFVAQVFTVCLKNEGVCSHQFWLQIWGCLKCYVQKCFVHNIIY